MAETIEWVAPDGAITTLRVLTNVSARFAPPVAITEEAVPGQAGARFREARHETREFVLPIHVGAASESELRATLRALTLAMDPVRGEGAIRVTTPMGDQREIRCRVASGFGLSESPTTTTPTDQLAVVVFRALDPYWYATSDVVSPEYTTGITATFFPILPVRLSSSEVFADLQVENTGDVDTWPVWDVTGPAADPVFRNLTTGKTLTLSGLTLVAGEVATVDTRPGYKTIYRQDGVNLFGYAIGSLWTLLAGNNAVRIEMGGATAGVSKLRLTYRPRWLTA